MDECKIQKMPEGLKPKGRPVGSTELAWCRAVSSGTGITVLVLQSSKPPEMSNLRSALHKLQNAHPILRSKLHYNAAANSFAFVVPSVSHLQIKAFDFSSTQRIFQNISAASISPLQMVLEHELNVNPWSTRPGLETEVNVLFATVYELKDAKWVLALRLHTAACDRATAVGLLRELKALMGGADQREAWSEGGINLGIEDLIPYGQAKKPTWAHGLDTLSYSVRSLRLTNLEFINAGGTRFSQVVRLQLGLHETQHILQGCKSRNIKLCSVLAAAGIIAGNSWRWSATGHRKKKFGVVTLIDCRPLLEPGLSARHFGFYNSAILNTVAAGGGEGLWDLASRCYRSFASSKSSNKHFTDMADINFLMCKAIENPGLTPSSSLRTSLISVFEDTVIEQSGDGRQEEEVGGVEDYMGCASVHGVGTSLAVFDTVRNGRLDCACVYPAPLHSREQMEALVEKMKNVLVEGGY